MNSFLYNSCCTLQLLKQVMRIKNLERRNVMYYRKYGLKRALKGEERKRRRDVRLTRID